MFLPFPVEVPISGISAREFLMDDRKIGYIELHPGDEVFVLGFPLAAAGPGGFPILRFGRIASYPLTPMRQIREIYLDLFIAGGNSGGPVYFSYANRVIDGRTDHRRYQGILGLVTQEAKSQLFSDKSLNFGVIVSAPFIQETINKLINEKGSPH
jgi:hypothetical protein